MESHILLAPETTPSGTQQEIAWQVSQSIEPLAQKGILLPKTETEIIENWNQWKILVESSRGKVLAFCEIRPFDEDLWEMGSVYSEAKGLGKRLLNIFENTRKTAGVSGAFAVTKDLKTAQDFFVQNTDGIITSFPPNFRRAKDDRHYVQWEQGINLNQS